MNKETEGLTLENRYDLILNDQQVEKELYRLQFPKISAEFIDTEKLKANCVPSLTFNGDESGSSNEINP